MPVPEAEAAGRTRKHHEQARLGGVGDELLPAVDDPAVTVGRCAGLQSRGVRPGPRLGERERRDDLTRGNSGQPPRLLLVGAEADQHLPGDPIVRPELERSASEV